MYIKYGAHEFSGKLIPIPQYHNLELIDVLEFMCALAVGVSGRKLSKNCFNFIHI